MVIDDDPDLCTLLEAIFTREQMTVTTALSGETALRELNTVQPDLILLDIMMPDMSGWEVARRIRISSDAPIIMLSALSQTGAIVRALEAGADDFISKPFNKMELMARIKALLRRTIFLDQNGSFDHDYDDGHLSVDLQTSKLYLQGKTEYLSPTEYRLFEYLFRNSGSVCSTINILEHVWGELIPNGMNYLHVYIWKLRKKIEPDPSNPRYLYTEHGIGYRFIRHH